MKVKQMFQSVKKSMVKNSPDILTGLSLVCTGGAVVFAVMDTAKSIKAIQAKEEELGRKLTKKEIFILCWKYYIRTGSMLTAAVLCNAKASSINHKRIAGLITDVNILDSTLTEYKKATKEVVGDKKEKEIIKQICKNKEEEVDKTPVMKNSASGLEITEMYDTLTKRRFYSDLETFKGYINDANTLMLRSSDNGISINDYCDCTRQPRVYMVPDGIDGDNSGWSVWSGLVNVRFIPIQRETGEIYYSIYHEEMPKADYWRLG